MAGEAEVTRPGVGEEPGIRGTVRPVAGQAAAQPVPLVVEEEGSSLLGMAADAGLHAELLVPEPLAPSVGIVAVDAGDAAFVEAMVGRQPELRADGGMAGEAAALR
jgi:hypothetical protein